MTDSSACPVPTGATAEWWAVRVEALCQPRSAEGWREMVAMIPEEHQSAAREYLRERWKILVARQAQQE